MKTRLIAMLAIAAMAAALMVPATALADSAGTGTIPTVSLTIPEGEFEKVNASEDHSYAAEGVVMDITVPAGYVNPDGYGAGYTGESGIALEYFRGRGNSTWDQDKKPYKIKLAKGKDLFGLGKNKHWALMANAAVYDGSLTKNRIVSWLGTKLGMAYTPRMVPVDLVVNGEYLGSYFLSEVVRLDTNRVDIAELGTGADDAVEPNVTGGYLFSMIMGENDEDVFHTTRDVGFRSKTPSYEEFEEDFAEDLAKGKVTEEDKPALRAVVDAQTAYLRGFVQSVEDAIFGEGDVSVASLMDLQSAADYWWIQEFTKNFDAFASTSTYLYKDRDGKLFWGPLWDFDQSMGIPDATGFNFCRTPWFDQLRQDPEFAELLEERWHVIDGYLDELTRQGGLIDQYIDEMSASWAANYEVWSDSYPEGGPATYAQSVGRVRDWIDARRAWINENLELVGQVFWKLTFMVGDEEQESHLLYAGSFMGIEEPTAPTKEGQEFLGWYTEDGTRFSEDLVVDCDMVFFARYSEKAQPGAVVTEVVIGEGAPKVTASNLDEIAEAALSDEEKAAVQGGAGARVWLEVSALEPAGIPAADKDALGKAASQLGAQAAEGGWTGIALYKQVEGFDKVAVTELPSPVKFSLEVSEALRNAPEGVARTFFLVRLHDGEAAVIAQGADAALAAESDRFSTHLIAYKDTKAADTPAAPAAKPADKKGGTTPKTAPKTADPMAGAIAFTIAAAAAGAALIICARTRRRSS